jgi:hypothetical protein
MPSARNYLIGVLISLVFGTGASSSQSRCATRLRHAPCQPLAIREGRESYQVGHCMHMLETMFGPINAKKRRVLELF